MQLGSEAQKVLVDSYVALRRGDTTPGSRVAYRMTVRQLEALIRLSEAIARSHLEVQVCQTNTVADVKFPLYITRHVYLYRPVYNGTAHGSEPPSFPNHVPGVYN